MAATKGSTDAPTVIIVGAGAAGIFAAYQIRKWWPGRYQVELYESSAKIGGNVSSVTVEYGGQEYTIDAGAQFFYRKAQPNYVKLIHELGLDDHLVLYPAGITIWDNATNERLLWIPSDVGGFVHYTADDWVRIVDFGVFLVAATLLNLPDQPDWSLSVGAWLADLPLGDGFKQNVIKNFLYQFVSLPYDRIDESSAVYATTYFVRNVFGGTAPTDGSATAAGMNIPTFQTDQCLIGLSGILDRALALSGAHAQVDASVTAVAPHAHGVTVTVNGETIDAQHVVMACDPGAAANLLAEGRTSKPELVTLLRDLGADYLNLPIMMQKDGGCWMPGDKKYWEAVSTVVDSRQHGVAFSAWFGPLRPPYDVKKLIPVFKSWGAPSLQSKDCGDVFYEHVHDVMLPTTDFVRLREQLDAYQGDNGLWFAGGWTNWFDSQEAALMSAFKVVQGLQPSPQVQPSSPSAVAYDSQALRGQVRAWIEMVRSRAPEPQKQRLAALTKQLE